MASSTDNDHQYPLGNPRSTLRRDLDRHAGSVIRRHSLWVDNDYPNPLTGKREKHFSWDNLREDTAIIAELATLETNPTAAIFNPRLRRILNAVAGASTYAGRIVGSEKDQVVSGIIANVLPMLEQMAIAASAGAIVGAGIGVFAGGGVGDEVTVPGLAIAGAELGVTIYGYYGLAMMLKEAGVHAGDFVRLILEATELALFAGENQGFSGGVRGWTEAEDMRDASELYAAALGELWWIVLQAIVIYITKKVVEVAGSAAGKSLGKAGRSPALQAAIAEAKGHVSKLGSTFGNWLDQNFEKIRESVEQHEKAKSIGDGGKSEGASPKESIQPKQGNEGTPKTGAFGKVPSSIKTSSGIDIKPTPGKTTTILGSYKSDMRDVINNQLEYPKTTDMGPKTDGFNVLNVPEGPYRDALSQGPDAFWNDYNKPFLDDAIGRGDPIAVATTPSDGVLYRDDGSLTGFGREIDYLGQNGYTYQPTTGMMVKR